MGIPTGPAFPIPVPMSWCSGTLTTVSESGGALSISQQLHMDIGVSPSDGQNFLQAFEREDDGFPRLLLQWDCLGKKKRHQRA